MQFGSFYGTAVLGDMRTTTPGVAQPVATTFRPGTQMPRYTTPGVVDPTKAPNLPPYDPGGGTPHDPGGGTPQDTEKKFPWGLAIGGAVALGVVWWLFKD
jgi:hypothetical protein